MSDYEVNSLGEKYKVTGASSQADAEATVVNHQVGNAGATALAGPLLIILIAPLVITALYSFLFGILFKLGIVGRVIQSVLMGLIIGFALLLGVGGFIQPMLNNFMLRFLVVGIFFGLPAVWYYCSNYFSLKAAAIGNIETSRNEKKKKKFARFFEGIGGTLHIFALTFSIAFYGAVIILILSYFLDFSNLLYLIPVAAAILFYIVKSLSVRDIAKEIKAKEGSPIIGVALALILSCILPFNALMNSANVEAGKAGAGSVIEATQDSATQNLTAIVIHREAWVKDAPSYSGNTIMHPKRRSVLKITGEAIQDGRRHWIPIEYEGVKGYILPEYIRIQE